MKQWGNISRSLCLGAFLLLFFLFEQKTLQPYSYSGQALYRGAKDTYNKTWVGISPMNFPMKRVGQKNLHVRIFYCINQTFFPSQRKSFALYITSLSFLLDKKRQREEKKKFSFKSFSLLIFSPDFSICQYGKRFSQNYQSN